ncbi:MAG TPA: penicillin-binding protein 1C [Chthoniobacterales bacterium]
MRRLVILAGLSALVAAGWFALPRPPLLDGVPFSRVARDREGHVLQIALATDDRRRIFTPLQAISPRIVEATFFHEDRHFDAHPGVNPVSLARAAAGWLFGAKRGGASTITMQVARLRGRMETRSLAGKCAQIFTALCLERHYSKRQILEAYFNLTPYGGNIEGVGAATEIYLHHAATDVSWPEAVTLAVIPQSPARRAPAPRRNPALAAAHARLHARMHAAGLVHDPLGGDYALCWDGRLPDAAPHFVNALPDGGRDVCTTLDATDQGILEDRVARAMRGMGTRGVRNAAAMLVDTRSMEVLASVGSANFWDRDIQGQVDGTRSPRSPGSTLKPLIYALALDQGLIHPRSLLLDAPQRFADYSPDNFDREFCGPISAADALARSRNVPAVDLAARLQRPRFHEFLGDVGIPLRGDEAALGLSLALGGAEVTMRDLVRLYAMLASGGTLRPLRMTRDSPVEPGRRVVSCEAAFLTLDMLARISRPDGAEADPGRVVAWKTGTSFGFRDAWSVAVFDHFVLAVWVGNFDGTPNPAFVGRTCAGPLLFSIIDGLVANGKARPGPLAPPPHANLRRVDLCALSGDLPGPDCADRVSGWFIPGVSPITVCPVHRGVWVDARSGLRRLQDNGFCRREVFEFWPSNVRRLFAEAGLPRRPLPPFAPDCAVDGMARQGAAPRILSPSEGAVLAVPASGGSSGIALEARTDGDVRKVYWFAGADFLGCAAPNEPLAWHAAPGRWQLLAMDDQGRVASRRVDVVAR